MADVAKMMEVTQSDICGFKPKSPVKFTPVVWNNTMLQDSAQQQPLLSTEYVQSANVEEPEVLDNESLPLYEENDDLLTLEPKSTSPSKVDKQQIETNKKFSNAENTETEENSTKKKINSQEVDKTPNKPKEDVDTS